MVFVLTPPYSTGAAQWQTCWRQLKQEEELIVLLLFFCFGLRCQRE